MQHQQLLPSILDNSGDDNDDEYEYDYLVSGKLHPASHPAQTLSPARPCWMTTEVELELWTGALAVPWTEATAWTVSVGSMRKGHSLVNIQQAGVDVIAKAAHELRPIHQPQ